MRTFFHLKKSHISSWRPFFHRIFYYVDSLLGRHLYEKQFLFIKLRCFTQHVEKNGHLSSSGYFFQPNTFWVTQEIFSKEKKKTSNHSIEDLWHWLFFFIEKCDHSLGILGFSINSIHRDEFSFVTDSYLFSLVRNFISFLLGRHLNKKKFQSLEKIYPEILK